MHWLKLIMPFWSCQSIDCFSVANLKPEVSFAHFPYYGFHLGYLYKMNQEVTKTPYEFLYFKKNLPPKGYKNRLFIAGGHYLTWSNYTLVTLCWNIWMKTWLSALGTECARHTEGPSNIWTSYQIRICCCCCCWSMS